MATGFFGKLPLRGDFVARGLPPGARAPVDRWLTRYLAPLARTPDDWPEGGFRGLITHDQGALALLILPGRDMSGRAFPLAAICPADGAGQAEIDLWADTALPAMTRACQGELDAEGLIALVEALGPDRGQSALNPPLIWARGEVPVDPAAFAERAGQN